MWTLLTSGVSAETFFLFRLGGSSSNFLLAYSLLASLCFSTYWAYDLWKKNVVFPHVNFWLRLTPYEKKHCFSTSLSLTLPSLHLGAPCTSWQRTATAFGGSAQDVAHETWPSSPHKRWHLEGRVSLVTLDGSAGKSAHCKFTEICGIIFITNKETHLIMLCSWPATQIIVYYFTTDK